MPSHLALVVPRGSRREQALRVIARALTGVSIETPAAEINRRLPYRPTAAYSCATWRRAVRAAQAERARWLAWECRPSAEVRPLRRGPALLGSPEYARTHPAAGAPSCPTPN